MTDWLHRRAALAPQKVAIDDRGTGRTLTYRQLDSRASALARAWSSELEPGARVAMLCADRAEVFEGLFAAAKAGVTLVPLNRRLATAELAHILEDADPRMLAYGPTERDRAAELFEARSMRGLALEGAQLEQDHLQWETLAGQGQGRHGSIELESVPLVLYTSGTTGGPKGVMLPWRQIVFNAISTGLALELDSSWRALGALPLFHTGGLHALATPVLHAGGKLVLTAGFDAEQAARLFEAGEVDSSIAVPTMYEMLAEVGLLSRSPERVKALMCGGAPLTDALHERYHEAGFPLRQGYGLTEVGPNCFSLSPLGGPDRIGTIGAATYYGEAKVVDEAGHEVGPDVPGELWLRGPHVSKGYLGRPELTAEVLREDGWFRTGDVLRKNERGVFAVVGRIKDMFISGGENVYPAEVENALRLHPEVGQVAVLGVPHPKWGQVGLAAIIPAEGTRPSEASLRGWCEPRLGRFKIPKHWRLVDAFPLNATGKVQKSALLEQLLPTLEGESA